MNETHAEVPAPEADGTESPVPENPVVSAPPAEPLAPAKSRKKIWLAGGVAGCIALFCGAAALIAVFVFFGLPLLQGDPIASVVPNDSVMYMSVDLAQAQSEKLNRVFAIAQDLTDAKKDQTPAASLDRLMKDEWDLSFTDEVVPWMGRHAALAITEGDFSNGEVKLMIILETRNKAKTDEFLKKFVAAMEKKGNMKFEQTEEEGITFYTDMATSDEGTVMARNGKFVYFSNSRETILASVKLQKSEALSGLKSYKDGLAVLPKNRLATVYLSEKGSTKAFESALTGMYGSSYSAYTRDLLGSGLTGMAMSLSVVDQGLRIDAATVFDETRFNAYQKEAMTTKYLPPKADALLPEDVFFFVGSNTSQAPGSYTKVDNPLYSSDVKESFDLLEKQYGIKLQDFIDLLGGEFAIGVGPAQDGLFAQGGANVGIAVLAGTKDEEGFVLWFENTLEKIVSKGTGAQYDTSEARIGEYRLKKLAFQGGYDSSSSLIYGADQGYIVLGTSQSMLENGLTGTHTLANDEVYRQTWAAFPRNSVPYMYFNLKGFMNWLTDQSNTLGTSEVRDTQEKLQDVPVIAVTLNNTGSSVRSVTMIVFMNK